jgi:hypothetical protein
MFRSWVVSFYQCPHLKEMLTAIAVSSIVFWAVEVEKLVKKDALKQQTGRSNHSIVSRIRRG